MQPSLFEPSPTSRQTVDRARDAALRKVQQRAGEVFMGLASACILRHLEAHGPTPGEELTHRCKVEGIVPHDDRAFGPVYMALVRSGKIQKVGTCRRERGHGTAGGHIWGLA